jgi:2',3'-cyclic-nucleotide 2'-phosphodiesterase (5'-nucleotidase family)
MSDNMVPVAQGTIRLLCINDVYCHYPINGQGGYAELATLLNQYRKGYEHNSLFLVNGDILGGSALTEMFKGEWMIDILEYLKTDYACIGMYCSRIRVDT